MTNDICTGRRTDTDSKLFQTIKHRLVRLGRELDLHLVATEFLVDRFGIHGPDTRARLDHLVETVIQFFRDIRVERQGSLVRGLFRTRKSLSAKHVPIDTFTDRRTHEHFDILLERVNQFFQSLLVDVRPVVEPYDSFTRLDQLG